MGQQDYALDGPTKAAEYGQRMGSKFLDPSHHNLSRTRIVALENMAIEARGCGRPPGGLRLAIDALTSE